MKYIVLACAALVSAGAVAVGGCATAPEPCTSEWVRWKTERFVGQFVRDHQKQFGDARAALAMLARPGAEETPAGVAGLILTAPGVVALASDFMSDLWPEVRGALSQCDTAPRAAQLFANILRDQGVDERAARALEGMGLLLDRGS